MVRSVLLGLLLCVVGGSSSLARTPPVPLALEVWPPSPVVLEKGQTRTLELRVRALEKGNLTTRVCAARYVLVNIRTDKVALEHPREKNPICIDVGVDLNTVKGKLTVFKLPLPPNSSVRLPAGRYRLLARLEGISDGAQARYTRLAPLYAAPVHILVR